MREKVFNAKCIGFIKVVLKRSVMHESTQICIKHCQNGRMINKTHVDYLHAGMMCKLYVTFIFGGWGYLYTANFQWHNK